MHTRYLGLSLLVLATVSLVAPIARAQDVIPNAGFENWTNGNPDGWMTSNIPQTLTTVTQTSDAHSGASAAKGEVTSFMGSPMIGSLWAGSQGRGFAVTTRPPALHGFYKFSPVGTDSMAVTVAISTAGRNAIGGGFFITSAATSVYQEFVANIQYATQAPPDTATITIMSIASPPHNGTWFEIDDLSFGAASDVDASGIVMPRAFDLEQNYPNPFRPSTKIYYEIPASSPVSLVVTDVLGRPVQTLVNADQAPGRYMVNVDGAQLPPGVYLYTLRTPRFVRSRLMTIAR